MRSLTGQWDSVRFIGLFGLLVYFSMRSLNKPNKPVYFSMHSLTGYQESVRFIGLFGLLVYFTMHTFTGEWDCVRFIRREVRHHRKHMLDDPPNMIDPINYVLLFCSIPLFKSFHVACMDNYVLKVGDIPLSLMVLFKFEFYNNTDLWGKVSCFHNLSVAAVSDYQPCHFLPDFD